MVLEKRMGWLGLVAFEFDMEEFSGAVEPVWNASLCVYSFPFFSMGCRSYLVLFTLSDWLPWLVVKFL